MTTDQPDLFDSAPPARVRVDPLPPAASVVLIIPFPMAARTGKVRDVARKLLATKTDRHASHYRDQVTEALRVHLRSKHVPGDQHAGEIASFWRAVDLEAARLQHGGRQQA